MYLLVNDFTIHQGLTTAPDKGPPLVSTLFFSLLLFVLYILSASSRILTRSSAPPWSLTHCCGAQSLLCLIKSKAGWGALVAVSLRCTFPPSCFPSTRLWGISAPSDPWWRGTQWPDMEANSWISKLLSGEVRNTASFYYYYYYYYYHYFYYYSSNTCNWIKYDNNKIMVTTIPLELLLRKQQLLH